MENSRGVTIESIARGLFIVLLFSPILAYFYLEWLHLPKTINYFYNFVFLILGFLYLSKKNIKIHSFIVLYFLFAIYKLVWNIVIISDTDIKTLTKVWYYTSDFSVVAMLIIVYNTRYSEKFIQTSKKIIVITLILAAIVSIIQVFNMSFFNVYIEEYFERINIYTYRRGSIFSFIHPYSAGYDFLPLLAITLSLLILNNDNKYIYILILGGIVAFLSNNRYIIICYLFLYSMLYIYYRNNRFKYSLFVIMATLFFYYFLKEMIGYDFLQWYNERLLAEGSLTETTRYKAIANFLRFFPQRPLFGFGEQTEEIKMASQNIGSSHIHVGYLSHLVNYGIVGCTFLYGAWMLIVKKLYQTAKKTNFWGSFFAFACILIAFATASGSSIFFYGIMFAFIFDKYYNDKFIEKTKAN